MSNSRLATRQMVSTGSRKRSGSAADDYEASTPRVSARFSDQPVTEIPSEEATTSSTPTRHDFGGIPGQRPLPDDGLAMSPVKRESSRRSVHSLASTDSQDVEMGEDDDEVPGSDGESASGDKPSRKKKKGQRFYCTDFPPCQLSFTRSEHLARHIRKHTGERPFECHCSRRFSRLDNLRQHAQTVHVNEDIPGDSLAATGTRFQRQIRTDRVRPPNVRPRASTASSGGHGAHGRGHSRNLSTSSITSTTSSVGLAEDTRPRPAPLVLGQDATARARLSLDTFNPAIPNTGPQFGFYQQSPTGYSSPTSTAFPTGGSSPQFTGGMHSPSLSLSRSSFYNGSRTPSRRLSVPSGISPYHTSPAQTAAYPPVYSGAPPQYQNSPSLVASPTSSVFSHRRHESDAELEWRRRTWHPGTHAAYANRPATSGLSYHQTPDDVAPALASQPAASQITRLPGIESFDRAPPRPAGHIRNATSPMRIDSRPMFPGPPDAVASADQRKVAPGWEANLHHNLNNLDIARSAPSDQLAAATQTGHAQHPRPTHALPPFQFPAAPAPAPAPESTPVDRSSKRQAWYGGPMPPPQPSQPIMIAHRTSPESSGSEGIPTPSTSHGRELHPAIMHANGMVELQPSGAALTEEQRAMQAHYQDKPEPVRADSGFHTYVHVPGQGPPVYMMQTGHEVHTQPPEWRPAAPARSSNDMGRLEALVAVATSENRAVGHQT